MLSHDTLLAARDAIRSKKISSVELTRQALDRIAKLDPQILAFNSTYPEIALRQAREVDEGKRTGPLAGVPIALKDNLCTSFGTTTCSSKMLENFRSPYDATVVKKLEQAGAVFVGKTNLDEFAMGSSTENSAFKTTRNPWDTTRVPGGSSGGSAAAVAAGESTISLGTDTAGSIRQPAAFCGVVGLKPTYGRVSRYGLIAFGSSLDCPGPVTRTVRDAALMLTAMAGPDERDGTTSTVPVPDYTADLEAGVRGLRIGLSPDYFRIRYPDPETGELRDQTLPDEITAPIYAAAELFRQAGAEIVEDVRMPNTHLAVPAYFVISRVEAASNLHRYDGVKYGHRTAEPVDDLWSLYRKSRAEAFGLQPKLRILMGMYVSGAQYAKQYYQRALQVRTLIRQDFDAAFDPSGPYRCHALLTPTTPTPAFKVGAVYGDSVLMQYADLLTVPANHAGTPGLSVPAGLSAEGLPLGLQLLGKDWDEATLLRIAARYEALTAEAAWRQVKPGVLA